MEEQRILHRDHTVVSTAGPVGAAYSVAEKNWKCTSCGADNFARRHKCYRCRAKKPNNSKSMVWHQGTTNAAAGIDHNWREAMDPNTRQVYYYNTITKETSWDRPKEMGMAPVATGWFGRGRVGAKTDLEAKKQEYIQRPAPRQSEKSANADVAYQEGSNEFNIWYGKYVGDQWKNKQKEPAESRCKVELHAGYTQADKKNPDTAYFCLWWARGLCNKGSLCPFFHRIPTIAECGRLEKDMLHDVFGRKRHAQHRDDMSGAGSFNDSCRTLFVGGLKRSSYEEKPKLLKEVIDRSFSEWGEVEHVNVVWRLAIAFVRFRMRSHAELAKEAMAQQELDHSEVLSLRWAHDDPNPVAKEANRRANADAVVAAIKMAGHTAAKPGFNHPSNYKMALPDNQDNKLPENFYPDTTSQYAGIGPPMPPAGYIAPLPIAQQVPPTTQVEGPKAKRQKTE